MQPANFTLEILTGDDGDGFVHLDISITNGLHKTSVDEYIDLLDFSEFANALVDFPEGSKECGLKIGEDSERYRTYVFLRAYIYDTLGHAGLEVKIRRNGAPIISTSSHFSIATEVASINSFGQALADWVDSGERLFSFDFYTGLH